MEQGGQYYYYHADGLGSIVAITDAAHAVVQSYEYDSYGMIKPSTSFANSFTFVGKEWDRETGLSRMGVRYYDFMEGRFVSKDPIGFAGGDTNLYGYVQNNPINFTDPTGLAPSYSKIKHGLIQVYELLGEKRLPKGEPGKFGSPQRGTPIKGYRLDPAHPNAEPGSPESVAHINWWDYTEGKRGKGGRSGAIALGSALLGFIGNIIDPFDAVAGELADEDEMSKIRNFNSGINQTCR